jgi:hypothetical protein
VMARERSRRAFSPGREPLACGMKETHSSKVIEMVLSVGGLVFESLQFRAVAGCCGEDWDGGENWVVVRQRSRAVSPGQRTPRLQNKRKTLAQRLLMWFSLLTIRFPGRCTFSPSWTERRPWNSMRRLV